MIRSNLVDYSDAYILFSETITITGAEGNVDEKQVDERNKGVMFRNSALFTYCLSSKNKTQIDNAKDIDGLVPVYNLTQYNDNYLKILGGLWENYRDEPSDQIVNSESLSSKIKLTGKTPAVGYTKNVEIAVALKY